MSFSARACRRTISSRTDPNTAAVLPLTLTLPPWAQIRDDRLGHIERTATLASRWAGLMGAPSIELNRWLKAVSLHDALKDAPSDLLSELTPDCWDVPALRHGPAAAALAAEYGESDQGVLNAVRYHSVGYAQWDSAGRILYLADFLEPGREFHRPVHDVLAERVPHDLHGVLHAVAAERLQEILEHGLPLLPETTQFWNALVGRS